MRISDWSSDVCSSDLRQIPYSKQQAGDHVVQLDVGVKGKNFWVTPHDRARARDWFAEGYTEALKTPDNTVVFVTEADKAMIRKDQTDCMGCLSHCGFSSWKDPDDSPTGYPADPRSFCLPQKLPDTPHAGAVAQKPNKQKTTG